MPPAAGARPGHRPPGDAPDRQPQHPGRDSVPADAPGVTAGPLQLVTHAYGSRGPRSLTWQSFLKENSSHGKPVRPAARLHPLLTAAAISVTVFSAVGIGAMTGLLPHSFGSAKEAVPFEVAQTAHAVTLPTPVAQPKVVDMPPAAPKATPKPRKVVKAAAPASMPAPSQRLRASRRASRKLRLQRNAEARSGRDPRRGRVGARGARRRPSDPTASARSPAASAGAVLGSQFGKERRQGLRKVLTVLGAAGGAFAGKEIEKQARARPATGKSTCACDDGTQRHVNSEHAAVLAGRRARALRRRHAAAGLDPLELQHDQSRQHRAGGRPAAGASISPSATARRGSRRRSPRSRAAPPPAPPARASSPRARCRRSRRAHAPPSSGAQPVHAQVRRHGRAAAAPCPIARSPRRWRRRTTAYS